MKCVYSQLIPRNIYQTQLDAQARRNGSESLTYPDILVMTIYPDILVMATVGAVSFSAFHIGFDKDSRGTNKCEFDSIPKNFSGSEL